MEDLTAHPGTEHKTNWTPRASIDRREIAPFAAHRLTSHGSAVEDPSTTPNDGPPTHSARSFEREWRTAYLILSNELLICLEAATKHDPIPYEEFRYGVVLAVKKAAGELS